MTIYLLFIILALVGVFSFDKKEEKSTVEHLFYVMLVLFLILLSSMSYMLGGDKILYMAYFEDIPLDVSMGEYVCDEFLDGGFMPLWSVVNYLSMKWFGSFYAVQTIQAIVVNSIIAFIGYKYTKNHFLFLLLYFVSKLFFLYNMEIMREGFAIAFGLLAIDAYFHRKIVPAIICLFVALGFHISAMFLIVIPFLNIRVNHVTLVVFVTIALIAFVCRNVVLNILLPIMSRWSSSYAEKIEIYLSYRLTFRNVIANIVHYIVLPYIIGISFLENDKETKLHSHVNIILLALLLVGCIVCIFSVQFARLANYFRVFYLVFCAHFICVTLAQKKRWSIHVVTCLLLGYFVYTQYVMHYPNSAIRSYQLYYPYTNCFNHDDYQSVFDLRTDYHIESVLEITDQL